MDQKITKKRMFQYVKNSHKKQKTFRSICY